MTSVKSAVSQLTADMELFSSQISGEIDELKRNVQPRPVTGATLFRHCLEDLSERVASMSDEMQTLESVTLDAISLEVWYLFSCSFRCLSALQ